MKRLLQYRFCALYFASIVLTNILYAWYGEALMWPTPFGGAPTWSPLALVVGFWFILRDFAQREVGNKVLYVMVAGMFASYVMAGPAVGMASAVAFIAGELVDWLVFTFTKRPFAQRVLASSLVAAPVDTFLFFWMADIMQVIPGVQMLSWPTVVTETLSKLVAVALIYRRLKSVSDAVPHAA